MISLGAKALLVTNLEESNMCVCYISWTNMILENNGLKKKHKKLKD